MGVPIKRTKNGNAIFISNTPEDWDATRKTAFLDEVVASGITNVNGDFSSVISAMQSGQTPTGAKAAPGREEEIQQSQAPRTTGTGILSGMAREGGQIATGATLGAGIGSFTPVGPVGGAAIGAGITGVVVPTIDAAVNGINNLFGTDFNTSTESWNNLLTSFGYENPDTFIEEIIASGTKGATNALAFTGIGKVIETLGALKATGLGENILTKVGQLLKANPASQITGEATGEITSDVAGAVAEKAGASPGVQAAAEFGGAIVGDLVGSGAPNFNPGGNKIDQVMDASTTAIPRAEQQILDAGQEAGVRVLRSDMFPPTTSVGKAAQEILEGIPGGTRKIRFEQHQEKIAAVKNIMKQYDASTAGYVADDLAEDLLRVRGDELTHWNGNKVKILTQLEENVDAVDTSATVDFIDETRAHLLGPLKYDEKSPIIKLLTDWEQRIQGNRFVDLEEIRSDLGEVIYSSDFDGIRPRALKISDEVYDSLRNDMGNYVENTIDTAARNQWETANTRIANMIKETKKGKLVTMLDSGEATPEEATRLLFNQDRSTINTLSENLSPAGIERAESGIVARWAENATERGKVSPNKFAAGIAEDLTSPTGEQRFSSFFQGGKKKALEGIERLLNITARAEDIANSSAVPKGLPTAVLPGVTYTAARKLGSNLIAGVVVGMGTLLTAGQLAKIYESPASRNLAIRLANTAPNSSREMELVKRLFEIVRIEAGNNSNTPEDTASDALSERGMVSTGLY